jgi:mannobiose 2-epimerase
MKKFNSLYRIGICVFLAALLSFGCKSRQDKAAYLGVKISDMENELTREMKIWYPRIIDTIHGGYWTNFEYDWTRSKDQDKMLVTQARGLWTASRAASFFPDDPVYRRAADHGYQFLINHMWDEKNGGFCQYYYPDSSQTVDPSNKLIYGNSFALYALSEYARINTDPAVLNWVRRTFNWLEQNAHDPIYLGYFNIVLPGHPVPPVDEASRELIKKVNWSAADEKDQNTSIHLLEALTNAYQVLPDSLVKQRLSEMLTLVRDTMVDRDGYLHLYFSRNWKAVINRDSSRHFILQHIGKDHISFGHNIETAFLLTEASENLFGKTDPKTQVVARKLLDHTLRNGFDHDFYGLFDKGYLFPGKPVEIIDSTKTWWAQVEAWHALALFSNLYPNEKVYPEAFQKMWQYMQKELIDHQYGGLYNSGLDKNPENKTFRKAHAWKGCYHDGRAFFHVVSYARKSQAGSGDRM